MMSRTSRSWRIVATLVLLGVAVAFAQAAPATALFPGGTTGRVAQVKETPVVQPPEPEVKWDALPPEIQAKVDPRILAELRGEVLPAHLGGGSDRANLPPSRGKSLDRTRFLVYLEAQADLQGVARQRFATKTARRTAVLNELVSTARATQGPVKALLETRMAMSEVAAYQPFHIFNGFAVEGNLDTIIELARRDDVARIVANYPLVPLWGNPKGSPSQAESPGRELGGLDPDNWNIDLVDAERVWDEFGITGEGAVVGGFDTGVDWTHPALQSGYRGYSPSGSDHNYNWFEADANLYPDGNLGPSLSVVPRDCDGHGTHTMGTMVGDGGTPGTQVGMAPGAAWIAAPGICGGTMPGEIGDDIGGMKTFQWFLCPTDLSGDLATADCSKAPDAVNHSWGSANPADDTFRPAIQALRAAGIAPVFAAGNPDAGPGSIGAPANAPEAISVGATDRTDQVAYFSGRGPSFYEGEQKPELSAPGVFVNSAVPGGGYSGPNWSGTSMAAPHVAGLVALMVSADLADGYRDFDVDELERFMEATAVDLGPAGPDDDYGYGRIDAYEAVRWVRSAGDLQGHVMDASSGSPIEGASVIGTWDAGTGSDDSFTCRTNAGGQYGTTVPAGTYDVTVGAWGYISDTFPGQVVIAGALSIADFRLTARPTGVLNGEVLSGTAPIDGALVYVDDHPAASFKTRADGTYTLTLPRGTHEIVVEAEGYRVLREAVSVTARGSTHDFSMTPAPIILLVDADTYSGWFYGWPVRRFFQWALESEGYLYDLWGVQYTTFNDTRVMPDGSLGYGVPSASTLGAYDLVIWAHGGGGYETSGGSTVSMGADDELMAYMDDGGRLIISGQDIGYYDEGTTFYNGYLHADYRMDGAAYEWDTLSGASFLDGLNLEITNASVRGYPNGTTYLRPDAVAPRDGAAFPVLTYDNGSGAAALAVSPCDAPYRAVYFAVGYENIGPRADNRDPAIAEVLDRSIGWAMRSRQVHGVSMAVVPAYRMRLPGGTATYDLQVVNEGTAAATYQLELTGNLWATRILDDADGTDRADKRRPSGRRHPTALEVEAVDLPPCGLQDLTLAVDLPGEADIGDRDTVTVTASLSPIGPPLASVEVTTMAFPEWQVEAAMPTARSRLGAASLSDGMHYHAIGGWGQDGWVSAANERYDACTGRWEAMAHLPKALANVGVAAVDEKIYVVGGMGDDHECHDTLYVYDLATDAWSAGASLPEPLCGAAAARVGGKLYMFGGNDGSGFSDRTYVYNPATGKWRERARMPGGARSYAVAAELDGQIYVVGGWPDLRIVEVYDPLMDSWSTAARMNVGRQSPGLTAAPDGHLYVSGGGDEWTGLDSAERYDPARDVWEIIPPLNDAKRAGSAAAFAAGQVFVVGGTDGGVSRVNESLRLLDSFCSSDKAVRQSAVQPGGRITYTVRINSDAVDLVDVSLVDPIPEGTTFAGFGIHPIGTTYDSGADEVTWRGAIPAGADPFTLTFGVDVAAGGWARGDLITNTAAFDSGTGMVFSRAVGTTVDFPDGSPSTKQVDRGRALAGTVLTYTVHIENGSRFASTFTLRDPIPAGATYVPGSLRHTLGSGGYDPADGVVTWTGTLPDFDVYVNDSGDYEWGDSDGHGRVPGVRFDWIDATGGAIAIASYMDDGYAGPFDIGFTFNYYGTDYTQFYVDSNGAVQFGDGYYWYDGCPIDSEYPNTSIHVLGGDRVVDGSAGKVYYQTFGIAPDRYTVVEFYQLRNYGGSAYSNLAIVLHENGAIKLQYEDMDASMTSGTVGIDDSDGSHIVEYLSTCPAAVHDNLAVVFLPDGATWWDIMPGTDVSFAVTTAASLPVNTWITNTAVIIGPNGTVRRSAGTLMNPVDLSSSVKQASRDWAGVGEVVRYDLTLENTGLLPATEAVLNDPIPPGTVYVPGSLTCTLGSGGYDPANDVITWTGTLAGAGGYAGCLPSAGYYTNASSDYEWGDSDGNGAVPGVTFDWVDISATGTPVFLGDDRSVGPVDIGFSFNFYDTQWTDLYINSNGFLSFGARAPGAYENECIPNASPPNDIVALVWDDLNPGITGDPVYYESFATCPVGSGDCMIVQYEDYHHWGGQGFEAGTFEAILYDDGDILVQFLDAGEEPGSVSTTGIEDGSGTRGVNYACNMPNSLHDNLAILFLPPGGEIGGCSASLAFSVTLDARRLHGTPVTNRASLDDGYGTVTDMEATFLARSSDLSGSFKQVAPGQVAPGGTVTYTIYVHNVGAQSTTGEVVDQLPALLAYESGSLVCGTGSCGYSAGVITWTGALAPRAMVPVRYRATVSPGARDGDLITNTAVINDSSWDTGYETRSVLTVSRPGPGPGGWEVYMPVMMRGR